MLYSAVWAGLVDEAKARGLGARLQTSKGPSEQLGARAVFMPSIVHRLPYFSDSCIVPSIFAPETF